VFNRLLTTLLLACQSSLPATQPHVRVDQCLDCKAAAHGPNHCHGSRSTARRESAAFVQLSSSCDPGVLDGQQIALPATFASPMMPPRPPVNVVKLSDHGGQFVLTVKCACGHARTAQPQTLARFAGWDALLVDVVKRMRCSRCDARNCSISVRPETKRDG